MLDIGSLTDLLLAADATIVGACGPQAAKGQTPATSAWFQRAEGWVRVDWSATPTPTQTTAAANVIAAYDYATATTQTLRAAAMSALTAPDGAYKLDRAIVLLSLDQFNLLRQWISAFQTAVAKATSLASLQAAVAALPALPDLTTAEAITAITNQITSGAAD